MNKSNNEPINQETDTNSGQIPTSQQPTVQGNPNQTQMPNDNSTASSPGTVMHGGFQPPPSLASSSSFPTGPSPNNGSVNSYYSPAKPIYKRWPILVGIVILIAVGGPSIVYALSRHDHPSPVKYSSLKPKKSQSSNQQPTASAPNTPSTTPSATTPPPAASTQPTISPSINLSDQDYGKSITISVGTIVHVSLSGTAGYHWSAEVRSDDQRIWGNGAFTQGSDGSLTDIFQALLAGQDTVGYNNNPDCYPSCSNEQPRAEWHVLLTVQ